MLGVRESGPAFPAFWLTGSNEVYAYEEKSSGTNIICKFYGARFGPDRDKAAWMARQGYDGLETLRGYNLIGSPTTWSARWDLTVPARARAFASRSRAVLEFCTH